MGASLRTYLSRLGAPDAINWLSVVSVLFFQTCASLITSGINFDERFGLFMLVRVSSLLAFVAVLGLGKWALVRVAASRPRPLITVSAFVLGIAASTALFDGLLVVTGLAEASFLARRIVLSLVGATVILIMVALVVTTAREHQAANKEIQRAIKDLRLVRVDTTNRIRERRKGLVETIQGLINDQLNQVAATGPQAVGVMRNLIDDVIRPLSHSLSKQPGIRRDSAVVEVSSTISWQQVVRGAFFSNPYSVVAFPSAISAIVATFLVLSFGLLGVGVTLAIFVGAVAINAALGVMWKGLPATTPLSLRIASFTLAVVPFQVFSVWFIAITTGFDLAVSSVRLLAWTGIVLGTWFVAALTTSVFRQLRSAHDELESTLTELRTELATLNATDHVLRKNIARVLHGPVQEAVASTLRRLQTSPEVSDHQEVVETLRRRVQEALGSVDSGSLEPINPMEELADLQELWEGSVVINVDIPAESHRVLNSYPLATPALLELIREACHNAIKHGDAHSIDIGVQVDEDQCFARFTVTNDGLPLQSSPTPGLGSSLFDDLTVSWELQACPTGCSVTGIVPLNRD